MNYSTLCTANHERRLYRKLNVFGQQSSNVEDGMLLATFRDPTPVLILPTEGLRARSRMAPLINLASSSSSPSGGT